MPALTTTVRHRCRRTWADGFELLTREDAGRDPYALRPRAFGCLQVHRRVADVVSPRQVHRACAFGSDLSAPAEALLTNIS